MFSKIIYKVIETNTHFFDTDVKVIVFGTEWKARKCFRDIVESIECDAEERFDEFGTDDDQCVGVREFGKDTFGIHEAGRASEWERTVRIEKDILR
mgnify:CR=1 FL=1